MTPESKPADQHLVRGLGQLDATMIVIGSGILITSAESARLIGSPGWLLMAWALAGLLTITRKAMVGPLKARHCHGRCPVLLF